MESKKDTIAGCDAVNAHVAKPIPEKLWHYTSFAGLQGILSSRKIWATEYRFLNDSEELLHARKLAEELLQDEPEYVGNKFPNRENISKAVGIAFNTGKLHEQRILVMVASFTEEGDQLSQWRGYADDSRGAAIGFNLCSIRPPARMGSAATFAPCIYTKAEKCALLKAIFAHYREELQNWWDKVVEIGLTRGKASPGQPIGHEVVAEHRSELDSVVSRGHAILQYDLLRAAPLLKNESFAEEREWRLVLPLGFEKARQAIQPVEFRPIRNAIVPYVAFTFHPDESEHFPFTSVVLGPGSHSSAEVGVKLLLQTQRIQAHVTRSNIPYRPT